MIISDYPNVFTLKLHLPNILDFFSCGAPLRPILCESLAGSFGMAKPFSHKVYLQAFSATNHHGFQRQYLLMHQSSWYLIMTFFCQCLMIFVKSHDFCCFGKSLIFVDWWTINLMYIQYVSKTTGTITRRLISRSTIY